MEVVDDKILKILHNILTEENESDVILHEVYLEGPPECPHYNCSFEMRDEEKETENTGLHYDGYYTEIDVSEVLQYERNNKIEEILK
jgi:hypothetical protein